MKILLVQTAFLGDIVLSTILISEIKKKHPNCKLTILTTPGGKELLEYDNKIDQIIVFDKHKKHCGLKGFLQIIKTLRSCKFDIVYSPHKSIRTSILLFLSSIPSRIGFRQAGFSFFYTEKKNYDFSKHSADRNLALLDLETAEGLRIIPKAINGNKTQAIIFPGSVWHTKRWHVAGYRRVAEHMLNLGYKVVVLGSSAEHEICEQVSKELNVQNLAGISLSDAVALIAGSGIVVCNDSLALHLASALQVPNVAIFCATSPNFGFGPYKNLAKTVEKEGLECKPCARHGGNSCPTGTEACMISLEHYKVISAIDAVLADAKT